jgi:hypothetical protein
MNHRLLCICLALLMGACSSVRMPPPPGEDWHAVSLPGKSITLYETTVKEGRPAIAAQSDSSASMWRRSLDVAADAIGEVHFSWWVPEPVSGAHVAESDKEDAAARVLFAFDGDTDALPMRTRMLFDLAEALSGERPPYATLMYVWDSQAPVGSVIVNPRTDRVRKIVVDSGQKHVGTWRDHKRNLAADFRLAFGEEPGRLRSMALMTDSDNTRTRSRAWYGPVRIGTPGSTQQTIAPNNGPAANPAGAPAPNNVACTQRNSPGVVRGAHTECKP